VQSTSIAGKKLAPRPASFLGKVAAGFLLATGLLIDAADAASAASSLREEDRRVGEVSYRLALSGRPNCSDAYPLTGLMFHHLAEYEAEDRAAMTRQYRLDKGPGILAVMADSPAAKAGLVAGDVILSVNGKPFTSPLEIAAEPNRKKWRKSVEASEKLIEDELRSGPAELLVLRDGREFRFRLTSIAGCPARVRLARSKQVNAFATHDRVIMTTALLEFLHNDDELAVVLAHEMSHVILRHPDRLDDQGVPRKGLFRGLGKNAARVWKTEEEADRLAVRLVASAGYDVGAMIPFWRRFYAKYEKLPQIFRTHPSLSARERITREAIQSLAPAAEAPPR
jgi:hypothetical protein